MFDVLKMSGVQAAEWLIIAKQLGLTAQMVTGVFLKAWKDYDSTKPSWHKLAKALAAIDGDVYEHASKKAKNNAGMFASLALDLEKAMNLL